MGVWEKDCWSWYEWLFNVLRPLLCLLGHISCFPLHNVDTVKLSGGTSPIAITYKNRCFAACECHRWKATKLQGLDKQCSGRGRGVKEICNTHRHKLQDVQIHSCLWWTRTSLVLGEQDVVCGLNFLFGGKLYQMSTMSEWSSKLD